MPSRCPPDAQVGTQVVHYNAGDIHDPIMIIMIVGNIIGTITMSSRTLIINSL